MTTTTLFRSIVLILLWLITTGAAAQTDSATRAEAVVKQLQAHNQDLDEADRHAKYCKMKASPLVFLRGTNHLFWADLAQDPRLQTFAAPDTRTWIQGDLHVFNYGTLVAADDTVIYSLNDFDDSLIADYQYDLWRMAVSLVLLVGDTKHKQAKAAALIEDFVHAYLDTLQAVNGNDYETLRLYRADNAAKPLRKFIDQAARASRQQYLNQWLDKERRFDFKERKDKLKPVDSPAAEKLRAALPNYVAALDSPLQQRPDYFQVKDLARRVGAGTGSLGTPRYYVLIEGASKDWKDDRILDVKLQGQVSAAPYLEQAQPFKNPAQRVLTAYRALSGSPDPHLGSLHWDGAEYSVRERSPYEDTVEGKKLRPKKLKPLAVAWGQVLALSHARADADFDPVLIDHQVEAGVLQAIGERRHTFVGQVKDVALEYAQQTVADYEVFRKRLAPKCKE